MSTDRCWYVLRLFQRQEAFVLRALTEKGFDAYLPKSRAYALHAKRKSVLTRPLIPGYLFARLPDDDAISAAFAMRGVLGAIGNSDGPQPIPAEWVGALVLAEACHRFDETWRPVIAGKRRYSHRWRSGERVKIVAGAAQGRIGEVSRTYGRNWLEVILGGYPVVVDQRHVTPLQVGLPQQVAA
jgi:transcriptional antiterminator RfaH